MIYFGSNRPRSALISRRDRGISFINPILLQVSSTYQRVLWLININRRPVDDTSYLQLIYFESSAASMPIVALHPALQPAFFSLLITLLVLIIEQNYPTWRSSRESSRLWQSPLHSPLLSTYR